MWTPKVIDSWAGPHGLVRFPGPKWVLSHTRSDVPPRRSCSIRSSGRYPNTYTCRLLRRYWVQSPSVWGMLRVPSSPCISLKEALRHPDFHFTPYGGSVHSRSYQPSGRVSGARASPRMRVHRSEEWRTRTRTSFGHEKGPGRVASGPEVFGLVDAAFRSLLLSVRKRPHPIDRLPRLPMARPDGRDVLH